MAKAKAQPQARTFADIQKDISSKEAEREKVLGVVARLDGELDALKQEALEPIRALAKDLGFQVVKAGAGTTAKAKTAGKASTVDTEAWLKEQLADGPKTEEDLRGAYPGGRLRLKSYAEKGLLKQGKDGAYTLA